MKQAQRVSHTQKAAAQDVIQPTMLNSMAGNDFATSLDRQCEWGIGVLDLKSPIFGKGVADLTLAEAEKAAGMIEARGQSVYCLSTVLFSGEVDGREAAFRNDDLGRIEHVISLCKIFRPRFVRLLSAKIRDRVTVDDSTAHLRACHPWVFDVYREAIDRIYEAGFGVTIENEIRNDIFGAPEEILSFFEELGRNDRVCFTWDAANLWEMGVRPTVEVYRTLRPLIGYYHVKGGSFRQEDGGEFLATSLEHCGWPVREVTREIVRDGLSPVICLNPPHGLRLAPLDLVRSAKEDLDFLRETIPEME